MFSCKSRSASSQSRAMFFSSAITKQGDVLFVHYLTFLRRIFMTTTEEVIYYKRSFITIDMIVTIDVFY